MQVLAALCKWTIHNGWSKSKQFADLKELKAFENIPILLSRHNTLTVSGLK